MARGPKSWRSCVIVRLRQKTFRPHTPSLRSPSRTHARPVHANRNISRAFYIYYFLLFISFHCFNLIASKNSFLCYYGNSSWVKELVLIRYANSETYIYKNDQQSLFGIFSVSFVIFSGRRWERETWRRENLSMRKKNGFYQKKKII